MTLVVIVKVSLLAQPWAGFPYLTPVAKLAGFASYIAKTESKFEEEGLALQAFPLTYSTLIIT